MKSIIIFLLFTFTCLNVNCQTDKKFNYESNQNDTHFKILLKSEKPISKEAKSVYPRFLNQRQVDSTYVSIIEKSILPEKLQRLNDRRAGFCFILFSLSGKVVSIKFSIQKEFIDLFSDDDLYTLYENLRRFEMDMSKIEIIYPEYWVEGTEAIFNLFIPLPLQQK